MKRCLLLSAITLFFISATQAQYSRVKRKGVKPVGNAVMYNAPSAYAIGQFAGKWQEVKRVNRQTQGPVDYSDTLFYNFMGKRVETHDGISIPLKGDAMIDGRNTLVAAADVFTIISMGNNQVVLDDGERIHTLIRVTQFYSESLPATSITPETYTMPIVITANALAGKWKVYRRDAKPGSEDNRTLIRSFTITDIKDASTATGMLTYYSAEKSEMVPVTLTVNGSSLHIVTPKKSWTMDVYKADGKNLVFGDATLMYYSKIL